jgi:NAD(P)-dependent dehydrogenase (short-subunit alcohol dehydrogenase family)
MSDGASSRRRLLGAATAVAAGAATMAAATTVPAYLAAPATNPPQPPPDRERFAGKAVLVTGGTSGIGEATVRAFAAEGALVAFCGRRTELGTRIEQEIAGAGGTARYVQADVRVPEQVERFVAAAVAAFGRLDIAVNNAGITITGPLHELTVEQWDDVQHTNARGIFLAIKYEAPAMLASGGGVIICTASESRRPGGAAYTASKQAVKGIVDAAAMDYGPQGIRVNAIAPGTTDTPFVRPPGLPDAVWEAFKRAWGPRNVSALERMATAEEIARSVLALCTDEFSFQAGSTVLVGGGPLGGGRMNMPPGAPT